MRLSSLLFNISDIFLTYDDRSWTKKLLPKV
ncbi:unnamed protein product, partial [marine sediment metagenome]